jgi:hypothetical protein
MGPHQVYLQFANLVAQNPNVTQFSDTRCDRVSHLITCYDLVNHGARYNDSLAGVGREQNRLARHRDIEDVFQSQIVPTDV